MQIDLSPAQRRRFEGRAVKVEWGNNGSKRSARWEREKRRFSCMPRIALSLPQQKIQSLIAHAFSRTHSPQEGTTQHNSQKHHLKHTPICAKWHLFSRRSSWKVRFFFGAIPRHNDIIASWGWLASVFRPIIFCFLSPRQGYFVGKRIGRRRNL